MKTKYIAFAALASLMLASCSNDEDFVPQDNLKDTPITIASAGVAELTTRAVTDGKLVGTEDNPVSMGVFITKETNDKYCFGNVMYTHNGTSWTTEELTLYEGENSTQQIYAYYPYVEGTTETVTVDATDQIDYLWAAPASLTSSTVSLTMNHALTKLVLDPTMGTEVATDDKIAKVEVGCMYPSGKWDVSTNIWSDLAELPQQVLEMTNYEVLVIPIKCELFPITVTTSTGRVFKVVIDLEEVGNELLPNTQYTIKLKVGQDKVELGAITAAPWGEPVEGGELETE